LKTDIQGEMFLSMILGSMFSAHIRGYGVRVCYFYGIICRAGFGLLLAKSWWLLSLWPPVNKTYSKTFGHNINLKTAVLWFDKESGPEASPCRVLGDNCLQSVRAR